MIELMKTEPLNPIGQCFESAAHQFVHARKQNPPSTIMVHGVGVANFPGQEGSPIGHAWLEMTNNRGVKVALDTTWGIATPIDNYRKLIQVSFTVEYTFEGFVALWRLHGFPGPWHPRIKAAIEEGKNYVGRKQTVIGTAESSPKHRHESNPGGTHSRE